MSTARITVCIPTYNRAHLLRQALDALCDQDLTSDEYVVAISDNCSTDQTPDVVTEYQDRLQIIYHRNTENVGQRANWDVVTALCDTPYLVWHPDDDLLAPGQLGRALSAFDTHEGAVLVCSPVLRQHYPGDPETLFQGAFLRATAARTSYSQPYVWDKAEWLALSVVGMPSSVVGAVFQYDAYRRCELWKDYDWWADLPLLAEMGLHGDVLSLPWVGAYIRLGGHQHKVQLLETNGSDFWRQQDKEFQLITKDILDLCEREKVPVIEFWAEQIRLSPLPQRARYLQLLKRALPSPLYKDLYKNVQRDIKKIEIIKVELILIAKLIAKLLMSNRRL